MKELQVKKSYEDFKTELDNELKKSVESFVRIGYLLKVARDTDILHESGYPNMQEFAKAEYNLSKDQVSRFIAINDKYSVNGYSDRLQEKYEGYGVAKLAEMLTLPEAVEDIIEPEMTRAEIQEIKREVREEQKKTDIEVMLEPKENEEMNRLQKFIYQYFKENKQDYIALWKIDLQTPAIEDLLDILAPSGIAVKTVRVSGAGKLMLSIQGIERDLELVDVRQNEKETHTWSELITTIKDMFADVVYKKEGWQQFYKEQFEEVAPVQPKKEYISPEIEEIDQIPGQMNVNDFLETIPGGGQVVDNTQTESEKNVEKIKCEEESTEEIPNVEEIAEIVEEGISENAEKIECGDACNDVEEVDRKAIENAQELVCAIATKDYEGANYIIDTLKKQIETLMNAEKTE